MSASPARRPLPDSLGSFAIVVAVIALIAVCAVARRPARQPNVLLITLDTVRSDHVGAYGAPHAATPNLDRLAARGLLFPHAFSVVPVTLASHATLLTGRYPPRHGVRGNSFYRLPDDTLTLATALRQRGYHTAAFVGAAVLDHRFGLNQGFDVYDDEMGSTRETLIAERDASAVVSRALAWVNGPEPRSPFFLWVHVFDPHHPYEPPEPFRSRFAASPYDGEIAHADEQIGRLLEALGTERRLEQTLVVATSDHGEALGEHGEATHGVLLYDSTLRVPLILAGPGVPRGVRASPDAVSLADVMPTVLGRLGPFDTAGLDGRDLLGADRGRQSLYAETYLPLDFYNWSPLRALRADGLKLIDGPTPELYDVAHDPDETHDIGGAHTARVRGMAAELSRIAAAPITPRDTRRTFDGDLAERLRSLGYAAGAGAPVDGRPPPGDRPNPRSRLPLLATIDRALALMRAGRREEAAAVWRTVLAEDSENHLAARMLGDTLFDLARNREAIDAYRRVLANGRDAGYFHYRIALLHEREAAYADAAREFRRLVEMNPESAAEIAQRGDELLARGAAGAALAYFEVLAQTPDARTRDAVRDSLVRALNVVGTERGNAGDLRSAIELFSRAASLAPSDFDSLANCGMAQLRAGQAGPASDSLARALALRPSEVRVLNPLAELKFRRGELRDARDLLVRSLAVDPRQPRIQSALRQVERRLSEGS